MPRDLEPSPTTWLHAIHQVTGDISRHFVLPTPEKRQEWADALKKVVRSIEGTVKRRKK